MKSYTGQSKPVNNKGIRGAEINEKQENSMAPLNWCGTAINQGSSGGVETNAG